MKFLLCADFLGGLFFFFCLFFWDWFQWDADACCPSGIPAKKGGWCASVSGYLQKSSRGEEHNSSNINIQPRSVWAHKRSSLDSLKQRKVMQGRGAHQMLHRFYLSRDVGYRLSVCLSASLRCRHRRHFVQFHERLPCSLRACIEEHFSGKRNCNSTDRANVCSSDRLWWYFSIFFKYILLLHTVHKHQY